MDTFERLNVDAGDLIEALSGSHEEGAWMVDLETGELVLAAPEEATGAPGNEDWEDPDRFLPVQPMGSREACQIMADFVLELPAGEGSRALDKALGRKDPFRSFQDTLLDFPDLGERWTRYHRTRMLDYAQAWLDDNLPEAALEVPSWLRRQLQAPGDRA
jgi:hypothetical protein